MELVTFNSIEDFLIANEESLLNNESFNNLLLGLALGMRDKKFIPKNPLFYSIKTQGEYTACALISDDDRPLMITAMPPNAVDLLIHKLMETQIELVAVIGDEATADYFKEHWNKIKGTTSKINTHLGIYECSKVLLPNPIAGKLIEANSNHKDILRIYIKNFLTDFCPEDPENDDETIEAIMDHHLNLSCIYLLQNNSYEIVSMAAIIRSTTNTETIGFVYTPNELRGKGYGSSTVALLSEQILGNGKRFANLFTDLTNLTSNSIYPKVGYVKIGQNIHYDFINQK